MDVHDGSVVRARQRALVRPERVLEGRQAVRPTSGSPTPPTARRWPTGRRRACIRPAPRSSRSPRWPRSTCGVLTPGQILYDDGELQDRRAEPAQRRQRRLRRAQPRARRCTVSSDVFFYNVGQALDGACGGTALQKWAPQARHRAHRPASTSRASSAGQGFLPTPAYINEVYKKDPGRFGKPWTTGDNVNLAVGQGYLQASPLQMAVAYAGIANELQGQASPRRCGSRTPRARAIQEFSTPSRTPARHPRRRSAR